MYDYKQFGTFTMAYSLTADPHFSRFTHEKGSIAYQDIHGVRIFVGDPFCSKFDAETVITAFVQESRQRSLPLVGMQCSLETARLFRPLGFDATHMGVETLIMKDWSVKGKKVGRRIRKAKKQGLTISEARWDSDADLADRAASISKAWRRTRKAKRPLQLLLREPTFRDAPDERTFFAWLNGTLVGYVTFEAIYEGHKQVGWYANINRRDDSHRIAIFDAIVEAALGCFKDDPDFRVLSLGLSPMACRHNDSGLANRMVQRITDLSYNYGNDGYNYKGIFQSKKNYWPKSFKKAPNQVTVRDTYCITHGPIPLNPVAKAFMGVGILPEGLMHTAGFATRITLSGMWQRYRDTMGSAALTFWKELTTGA